MASNTTYGDYMRDMPGGLRNIGKPLTIAAFGVLVVALFLCMANVIAAGVVLAVGEGTVAVLAVRDREHRNIADRAVERVSYRRQIRTGRALYRSGMLSPVDAGGCLLPGVCSHMELTEASDGFGRRFALVSHGHTGEYALLMACQPQGVGMADDDVEDAYVAAWAHVLESLADEDGVTQLAVSVDTAPDSGVRFRRNLTRRMVDDAPDLAARCMRQVMGSYATGGAATDTILTLTFRYRDRRGRFLDRDEAARRIGGLIPSLCERVGAAGGGTPRCLEADEIARMVAVSYDPAMQDAIDAQDTPPYVAWQDAGPTAAEARWDFYRHDSGVSRTWQMCDPPSSNVTSSILGALLGPLPECDRKRVTLLFRPVPSDRTAFLTEDNRRKAANQIGQEKRASMRSSKQLAQADRQAAEATNGAVLVYFGLLATVTVMAGEHEEDRLEAASRAVESAAGAARINLRPCYGAQDSGFAAGLPLGLDVHSYRPAGLTGLID